MRNILLFMLLFSSSVAMASEISSYVGKLYFDSKFANEVGLNEEAWTVDGRMDFKLQDNFFVELGIGALFVDDKQGFTQEVTYTDRYYDRNTHIEKSSETGFLLSIASKMNFPMTDIFSGNVLIGYEYINFDREIAYCESCYSESVDIDAGIFLGLGTGISFGQDMELKFQYKMYLSDGDVDNQTLVGFSFLF